MQKLQNFNTGNYTNGSKARIILWYFVNYFILNSNIPWPYYFKCWLLRLFGGKIGKGVIIKGRVRIKNAWRLRIGDHCWIGEDVWIDNLENVEIGNNVCISQGAMLLTGNHDYSVSDFPYRLKRITIEDGVWIGAKAVVCPGVICRSNSILTVNSVAVKEMEAMKIYSGNPAHCVRNRKFI
ncbi:MAG: WcaF family extracellular polysaccharide biosynthesis acetyltransferase [Bacteroidota bacterium]|nr:WcaF family extracellular polysaccharide biosynthesis acetyltransferase [Bacteroidota bacterium]